MAYRVQHRLCGSLRLHVCVLAGWISADHEEILAGHDLAVPGTGGKQHAVADRQLAFYTAGTAEQHAAVALGYPERLMCTAVIMVIVEYAIPPCVAPAVAPKRDLECPSQVAVAVECAPIDDNR